MDVQMVLTQWLGQLANSLPLGYGFGAGMVSAVNPCGFAMLPAYLSLYLGAGDEYYQQKSILFRLLKAVLVSAVVTAGFSLLFLLAGGLILLGSSYLADIMPWIAVVVGVGLVLLGVWLLLGHHLSLGFLLSLANKVGDPRKISFVGFFLFGLAFGMTSMSCTLPIFLAVVGSGISQGDIMEGLKQFVAYILGVGSILTVLTVSIALVKQGGVVTFLRRFQPYVEKISAIFLIGAGIYIIYYWFVSGLLFS